MAVLVVLVLIALVVGIGGLIKGLLWLAIVGFILLLIGLAFGISRTRSSH